MPVSNVLDDKELYKFRELNSETCIAVQVVDPVITSGIVESEQALLEYVGNYQYVGMSRSGTATSTAQWKLLRVTYSSGKVVAIQYADGNKTYDNKWDDRLTKVYS
jgi:hypothetical protein